jgi:hypothetical protein
MENSFPFFVFSVCQALREDVTSILDGNSVLYNETTIRDCKEKTVHNFLIPANGTSSSCRFFDVIEQYTLQNRESYFANHEKSKQCSSMFQYVANSRHITSIM